LIPVPPSARPTFVLHARDHTLTLGLQTKIMGIINMTPDSFSEDGVFSRRKKNKKLNPLETALRQTAGLIHDGADILDVGGESTRPGARPVSLKEEIRRVIPFVKLLSKKFPHVPVSVDTYKSTVARQALDAGAGIINNIKGVRSERSLLKMVARYHAAIVLMHIRGTPRTMQKGKIHYGKIIAEITSSLRNSIENCLEIGIKSDRIIIDPGIGFGKTLEDNLVIIHRLAEFKVLHQPVLIGTSRKSFIGKILNKDVTHRMMGTAATVCAAILNGAHIVRIHDVKTIKDAVVMTDAVLHPQIYS
jgi:dihydropteroate synthase